MSQGSHPEFPFLEAICRPHFGVSVTGPWDGGQPARGRQEATSKTSHCSGWCSGQRLGEGPDELGGELGIAAVDGGIEALDPVVFLAGSEPHTRAACGRLLSCPAGTASTRYRPWRAGFFFVFCCCSSDYAPRLHRHKPLR
ncbi:hypothetical protein ACFFX0_31265 [Citricoccus parietis]|uniref:Uncharacterized protein n=1 Tax=Citricoccus parietis TaxID=592307 RepID=A0ABV5G8W5_9MICC